MSDIVTLEVFGGLWPAGMFEDPDTEIVEIDVPIAQSCHFCDELFVEGDQGVIVGADDERLRGLRAVKQKGLSQHKECGLRAVVGGIGHHVDHAFYCRSELGPDAGLTRRQSALLVWDFYVEQKTVNREYLETLR